MSKIYLGKDFEREMKFFHEMNMRNTTIFPENKGVPVNERKGDDIDAIKFLIRDYIKYFGPKLIAVCPEFKEDFEALDIK
jgi:hypothetical protein